MAGLMLAGDLLIDRLDDNGASTGWLGPLNGIQLSINPAESEKKTRVSRMRDTRGQALDTVEIAQPQTITVQVDDQPQDILAMAFRGGIEAISEGSGTGATYNAFTVIHDRWVELPHRKISAVVVKDDTDTTTYTVGTDYEVNARMGLIRVLGTGAVANGATLHITYDHAAVTGTRVNGAVASEIRARIKLDGKNLITGRDIQFFARRVTLSPEGEVDLLSEEFVITSLTGTLETPTGETEPYVLDQLD